MKLWIRSQDRERLGQIVFIEYEKDDYGYHLIGWRDKFEGTRLGTYKTKERALEVLDEIQKYLIPNIELLDEKLDGKQVCQIGNILTMVYEMPKE